MAEADETLPKIAGVEGVEATSVLDAYNGVFTEKGGPVLQRECDTGEGELSVLAPRAGSAHGAVLRPVVLEGRAPDPTRPDEVTANLAAAGMGIHVGQTISASIGEFCPEGSVPARESIDLHVVGIVTDTVGIEAEVGVSIRALHATSALSAWARSRELERNSYAAVRLAEGASAAVVERSGLPVAVALSGDDLRAAARRGVYPDVIVLLLIAGLGLLGIVLVLAPLLVRIELGLLRDVDALRALGCTRSDLAKVGALHGAALAALSLPVVALDRRGREHPHPGGRRRTVRAVTRHAGGPVRPRVRLSALRRNGDRARPPRLRPSRGDARTGSGNGRRSSVRPATPASLPPACSGCAWPSRAAAAGGSASPGEWSRRSSRSSSSSARSRSPPAWPTWTGVHACSAGTGTPWGSVATTSSASLRQDPDVEQATAGTFWAANYELFRLGPDRLTTWMLTFREGPAQIGPTIVSGRRPERPGEIVLHPRFLDQLRLDVGDDLEIAADEGSGGRSSRPVTVSVVGSAILPLDPDQLDVGSAMTFEGLRQLVTDLGVPDADHLRPEIVLADFAPGVDAAAMNRELQQRGVIEDSLEIFDADSPRGGPLTGVRLDGVATVPKALGIMAAVLALFVMAFLVIDRVGDWRAELALHRVLGFSRRQLRWSVAIGSIALGSVVAAIGIPLGVAAGRVAWLFYADRLGVKPEAVVPVGQLALVGAAVIAIAVLAALVPGRRASRRSPALLLRAG